MAGTPPSEPDDPTGDAPEHGGGKPLAAQPGQHQGGGPGATGTGADRGRHEMPGPAGYPQFEGPGAAQYGNEPVEPPPPMPPPPGAPQHPPAPEYGPPGTGPVPMPPPGAPPQYGAMPPQPGAIPPPPGTMPPPPGAYPPGTPPQQTYGYQAAGAVVGLDVGNALSYGWERFRANPGPWIGVTALGVVIYLAFVLVVQVTQVKSLIPLLIVFLAVMVGVWLLQAVMVRGALFETDGNRPAFGSYFRFINAGNVLLTALMAFAATWIGIGFCVLPGLIIGVLFMFALHFVIDQDQGPFTALKSSATLVIANAWQVTLLALAVMVITLVGALLCGFGLLIAGPVAVIAVTYAYRVLTDGVAAPL